MRDLSDVPFNPIALLPFFKDSQDLPLMFFIDHVYEIDNHDATDTSQSQLSWNGSCRFKIGPVDRIFKIFPPYKGSGIDINGRHGFGLINNQIAAGLEWHFLLQSGLDLIFQVVSIKKLQV